MDKSYTAALIVIGNEILSGRTQDKNINYIANKMVDHGIALVDVRIIPDVEEDIIATVRALKDKVTYLFTTGGIGPTHDDITS
ncbi:MAG: competence/damage-inducible protein A, partial [Alphaproteobacteria bacterium]|nr:competence/damage-inducible protein A [Alphaproteobacteria bacterium]